MFPATIMPVSHYKTTTIKMVTVIPEGPTHERNYGKQFFHYSSLRAEITGGKEHTSEMTTNSKTFILKFIKTKYTSLEIIGEKRPHETYTITA
jgi:hypothetical protein